MTEGPKTCTESSRETGFQSLFCDFLLAIDPSGSSTQYLRSRELLKGAGPGRRAADSAWN